MAKTDLKKLTVLIWDNGTFLSFAQRLGREFGTVKFYAPWNAQPYPCMRDNLVGEGMEGVERVDSFWDNVEDADLIVFFDVYQGDLQDYLVSKGKRVWGGRSGDELELDRSLTREIQEGLGLKVNKAVEIEGLEELKAHLKGREDKFVKIPVYRGDGETFPAKNYDLVKQRLGALEHELGDGKDIAKFIVEDSIDAVCEAGIDVYSIDGEYPKEVLFGYEIKDCGYGGVVKNWGSLSELLTIFPEKIAPTLKKIKYRQFMSTEVRVDKDKTPYMIDFTARAPAPPNELMQELISNWGEIMYYGADGEMIQPEYTAKYGVEIIIKSEWACDQWQSIYFPEKIAQWVKLKNACCINGIINVIPQPYHLSDIGAVVAIGDSMEDCIEKVKGYIEEIKGYSLSIATESILEKLNVQIEAGKKVGITF